MRRCAVRTCRASAVNDKNRKFFRFPSDIQTCIEWAEAIGRPELIEKGCSKLRFSYMLCDLHFDPSALDSLKRYLKNTVVPTLNLPSSEDENPSKQTQASLPKSTANVLLEHKETHPVFEEKKRKAGDEYIALLKHVNDRKVTVNLKKIIKMKQNLETLDNEKIRFLALNIFLNTQQTYGILRELLSLPSERALHKTSIDTKSTNILKCLETKIMTYKESDKYCIICAHEIALKSSLHYQIDKDKIIGFQEIDGNQSRVPATHALVIWARGLFSNWQQPLGYCLVGQFRDHEELNKWFGVMISKTLNIGFKIVALFPAEGSFFYDMTQGRLLTNQVGETYFTVNENKIYCIFDTRDLIKSLVNNLMKYDFEFYDEGRTKLTATWKDIETLYMLDVTRSCRLAPGLTKSHIDPNKAKQLKTKQYSEIFSKSVAAAMSAYKDLGEFGEQCLGTIKLIELLNDTFDVLNSSLIADPSVSISKQMETLIRFLDFTTDVTVLDNNTRTFVTNQMSCLNDLRTSLTSIVELSASLNLLGFSALPTRNLNQSVLQKFFDDLRQQNKRPTPSQFTRAFQKLCMMNLLKDNNRSSGLDGLLIHEDAMNDLLKDYEPTGAVVLRVNTVDYRFHLPAHSALVFLSRYLLKKCYEFHKCDRFGKYLLSAGKVERGDIMDLNPNVEAICPPDIFIELIKKMDEIFVDSLQNNKDFNNMGNKILKEMNWITFDGCCTCFPILYLKKLFIRFRIFNTIRFNNNNFKIKDDNPKFFNIFNL